LPQAVSRSSPAIRAAEFEKLVSMLTKPRWLLHLEGACILALTLVLYQAGHFRWWLFAVLLLAPDLAMLGYFANVKIGAALYNLVHTEIGPVLLLVASVAVPLPGSEPYALIWLAHLGMDRMLGYGLKYPTQFKDTHLQHV
jgi:hypothetical protein